MDTTKRLIIVCFAIFCILLALSACSTGNNRNDVNQSQEDSERDIDIIESEPSTSGSGVSPVRTLSVLAPAFEFQEGISFAEQWFYRPWVDYTDLLTQTARDLRRYWNTRDCGSIFEMNLHTYTQSEIDAVNTRLRRLMLMAGQGYDLIIMHDQPLWTFARAGVLKDIYTLIYDCSMTSGDDFIHLDIGNSELLRFAPNVLATVTGNFIDFDNRVSHLNSAQYIEFLEEFTQIYPRGGTGDLFHWFWWSANLPHIGGLTTFSEQFAFVDMSYQLFIELPTFLRIP